MYVLKETTEIVKKLDDIICNRCRKSCKGHFDFENANVSYWAGYDSEIFGDQNVVEFDLCEGCLEWLVLQLAIPPETHR